MQRYGKVWIECVSVAQANNNIIFYQGAFLACFVFLCSLGFAAAQEGKNKPKWNAKQLKSAAGGCSVELSLDLASNVCSCARFREPSDTASSKGDLAGALKFYKELLGERDPSWQSTCLCANSLCVPQFWNLLK